MTNVRLEPVELTETNLVGADIYGLDDYKIGAISDMQSLGGQGQAIVDVGASTRLKCATAAVNFNDLDLFWDAHGKVCGVATFSRDQLKSSLEVRS